MVIRRYWLLVVLFILYRSSVAQVDILLSPNDLEKNEIKKIAGSYINFVNTMSLPGNPEGKKAISIKFMREVLVKGGGVMTINDIDSLNKGNINFLIYMNRLATAKAGILTHSFDSTTFTYEKIKYDKWRRFYYVEVKVKKGISWTEIQQKRDTLLNDSLSKLTENRILQNEINPVSIFIKFEKENNISKNFRLWAINKDGEMPTLSELEPLQLWWAGLEPEWKSMLSKIRKMEEYPKESELERLTYLSELNLEKAIFKSYEPLSVFTNVSKLILTGASISSFEPISKMTGLVYLDISKSQIKDISGVEKLVKLEEFYCIGNQLTTIQPVASLVNLIKFNCSENDLEDIGAVKELINLKELNVSLNIKVKNIDAVKNLINIEKLSFRKIEIKDLTPVQNMKNLVYLDCYNTGIVSLEPIRNMQKIFHLDLSSNKVTSLEPIKNYRYIINLYLSYSSVSDLTVVDNFTLLRELEIYGCPQITSLGGVHKLEYLKAIKCHFTKIGKDEIQRFKKNHPNCAITYY